MVSTSGGHCLPPNLVASSTVRRRVFAPVLHETEQLSQPPQLLTTQSNGHAVAAAPVHGLVSRWVLHAFPPDAGGRSSARLRTWNPEHVALHADHAPQFDATQSVGQFWLLQSGDSVVGGHATPPNAAAVSTARVRYLRPPPHVAEHLLNDPQEATWQSCGHGCTLHS